MECLNFGFLTPFPSPFLHHLHVRSRFHNANILFIFSGKLFFNKFSLAFKEPLTSSVKMRVVSESHIRMMLYNLVITSGYLFIWPGFFWTSSEQPICFFLSLFLLSLYSLSMEISQFHIKYIDISPKRTTRVFPSSSSVYYNEFNSKPFARGEWKKRIQCFSVI